jgi:HEAT repeat protein
MPLIKGRGPATRRAERPALALDPAASPDRRRAAALACAGDLAATPVLLAALAEEQDPAVREAIVTALVANCDDAAAQGLAALIGSEDAALRSAAIGGLRGMRAEAALAPLLALLGHEDADRRLLAAGMLDAFPPAAVRGALHGVLARDPEPNVGLAAVEVLTQVGEAEDVGALRGFAARFAGEPLVAFAVEMAIERIGAAP